MGWDFSHRDKGVTTREFFAKEFSWPIEDIATVSPTETYAALRDPKTGTVKGAVILTQWVQKDYFNFGYKDMDEISEPFYYNCPARILDLLSPTEHPGALAWREKCRQRIADKGKLKGLRPGTTLVFDPPLTFTGGIGMQSRAVLLDPRRNLFLVAGQKATIPRRCQMSAQVEE